MSFRAKITFSYLAIILIFLILGIYVFYAVQTMADDLAFLDQKYEATAELSSSLESTAHTLLALETSQLTLHKLILGEQEALSAFETSIVDFDHYLDQVLTTLSPENSRLAAGDDHVVSEQQAVLAALHAVQDEHEHYHEDAQLLIGHVNAGEIDQAGDFLDQELDAELISLNQDLDLVEENIEALVQAEQVHFDETLHGTEETLALLRSAALILFVASILMVIILSTWMTQQITHPIRHLSNAAVSIEEGRQNLEPLQAISSRKDEFGPLARVFIRMAEEVHLREHRLKEQVQQLQIKIDHKKEDQQVAEITETDFFKQLEAKANQLRSRSDSGAET